MNKIRSNYVFLEIGKMSYPLSAAWDMLWLVTISRKQHRIIDLLLGKYPDELASAFQPQVKRGYLRLQR